MKIKRLLLGVLIAISVLWGAMPIAFAQLSFSDIPSGAWYAKDVEAACIAGLINGKAEDIFAPNDNLTYAEVIKLAACMHQRYSTGCVTITGGDPWYLPYVEYCKENGITNREYDLEQSVTRAGYIEIFANALPDEALTEINSIKNGEIPDVPMTHMQAGAIYKLYRAGVIQGTGNEHLCNPSAGITRAEVAAILTRMMDSSERIVFKLSMGSSGESNRGSNSDRQESPTQKPDGDTSDDVDKEDLGPNDLPIVIGPGNGPSQKPGGGSSDYEIDDDDLGVNDLPIVGGGSGSENGGGGSDDYEIDDSDLGVNDLPIVMG